jgi:hypothetical protein
MRTRVAVLVLCVAVATGAAAAEVGGRTHTATFTVHFDRQVPGVGQAAAWSSKLHQFSVAAGTRILHVSVDVSGDVDTDLEHATALARRVADAL